jgi:short-subunit dehydrogenase
VVHVRDAVCLVAGASGGIGRASAVRLARAGARLVLTGRDREALAQVASLTGGTVVVADLTEPGEPERCVDEAARALGRVDVLVCAAGAGTAGPFADGDSDADDELIRLNLAAPVRLTRAALPGMVERGRGWVVHVASIAGHVGVRDEAVYSATKAALISFAEALRYEVAGSGVGVTVVSPGAVRTAFFERRGRPYGRTFPRPIGADHVARALVRGVEHGRAEVFVPAWMSGVARFRGLAPGAFRALAGRYG